MVQYEIGKEDDCKGEKRKDKKQRFWKKQNIHLSRDELISGSIFLWNCVQKISQYNKS